MVEIDGRDGFARIPCRIGNFLSMARICVGYAFESELWWDLLRFARQVSLVDGSTSSTSEVD